MRLVVVALCMGAVAGLLFVVLSHWLAARARSAGPCELPAGMDSVELACDLRLARQDAQLQADELNRPE